MDTKYCHRCSRDLPVEQFCKNRSRKDGLADQCRECKKAQDRESRLKNLDAYKLKKQEYYQKNRDHIIAKSSLQAKKDPVSHNARCRIAKEKIKNSVLSHYSSGSLQCKHCCECNIDVLTIDHVLGNGAEHRRQINMGDRCGYNFYRWLKKNNFPDGFQVLCYNCQYKKRLLEMRPENPTYLQQVRSAYVRRVKLECLDAYGGRVCTCGIDDADVLTLDHVNDDGAEHRAATNTKGFNFYMYLRKNGFPTDVRLQTLCMNCQIKKRGEYYERKTRLHEATLNSSQPDSV